MPDLKSYLSIVANSRVVEVWVIDQDLLTLLPVDVQSKIINRLKAQTKVKIQEDDERKRPREYELKRLRERQELEDRENVQKQFEFPNTARVVKKYRNIRDAAYSEVKKHELLSKKADELARNEPS